MPWKYVLKKGTYLTLLFVISLHQEALSVEIVPRLTITPNSAITDDQINVECATEPGSDVAAVYFKLLRDNQDITSMGIHCQLNTEIVTTASFPCTLPNCQRTRLSCSSVFFEIKSAQRDTIQGNYRCKVQHIKSDFSQASGESNAVQLTVGDKTPPVERFTVVDQRSGVEIVNGATVDAGTNTTVTCETRQSSPEPAFVVSISGKEDRTNLTVGHSISFHESVPRVPVVVYRCEVYNGFGERQWQNFTINTIYGPIPSEVTIPKEVLIQSDSEVEICSIRNHPSQPLQITEFDSEMVQPGYPKYKEEPGVSRAFVKLSAKAAEVKDAKLEYTCSINGQSPVRASVVLVASNSAMMTAGIVIAAILAFLIIVAGIAYALKKRSASPKPQADKARYDRVNQNDANQAYNNPAPGRKADSNYQPVCV